MQYYFIYIGFAFGAVAVAMFLSAKSKYKWPKEKGKKRQWMTNGQYLNVRIRTWWETGFIRWLHSTWREKLFEEGREHK